MFYGTNDNCFKRITYYTLGIKIVNSLHQNKTKKKKKCRQVGIIPSISDNLYFHVMQFCVVVNY